MTMLVVAAHPDDEVLGCGGTIARCAQEGHDVYIAILGEGSTSRHASREQASGQEVDALRVDSRRAAELLGARDVSFHDLPDNRFDSVPLLDVVKIVEELIDRLAPEVVYTQHGGDLNIDHVCTYRATLTATRPMAGLPIKAVYAYEVASSTEWSFQRFSPVFHPNAFVDIGETLAIKLEAMAAYRSEARAFPHPRSPEALKASATRWGSVIGCEAAEAFDLVWSVR